MNEMCHIINTSLCLTHPPFLEGLKKKSQVEDNGKREGVGARSLTRSIRGVEGRAGAPGLNKEEGQAIHLLEPASKPTTKWLVHILDHFWCWDKPRATRTHLTHHDPDSGEATTFSLIVFYAFLHRNYIQMALFPGTPKVES
jgi:hypothetical protein